MSCPALETVAAYSIGELEPDAEQVFEEHYFGCDACYRRAEAMRNLLEKLEKSLPSVLTPARRERLSRAVQPLLSVRVKPGERQQIRLGPERHFGVWVMEAPVADAERVDLEVRSAEGASLFAISDVPFDRERNEVVLACQAHYGRLPMPSDLYVQLTRVDAQGSRPIAEYVLDHVFESS